MFNLQVYLLFSDSKTMATIVNHTCKSFIKLTPGPAVYRDDIATRDVKKLKKVQHNYVIKYKADSLLLCRHFHIACAQMF